MQDWTNLFIPLMALFGAIGWLITFMETYRHFPKMDGRKRLKMSIIMATVMTIFLVIISYIFSYFYLGVLTAK